MSKNRGFYLLNILVGISLVLFSLTLGFVWLRNYVESQEIKRAKTEIYEVFATYSAEAFNSSNLLGQGLSPQPQINPTLLLLTSRWPKSVMWSTKPQGRPGNGKESVDNTKS